MLAALLLQLALVSPSADFPEQTGVYVRGEAATRYPGQVERIEAAAGRSAGGPRVLVRFCRQEGAFGFVADGPDAPALLSGRRRWGLTRYVFLSGNGKVLDFRDRMTGGPYLPFSFRLQPDALVPVCLDEAGQLLEKTELLGDAFFLKRGAGPVTVPDTSGATVIELCDDLLVGTSRHFRDVGTSRIARHEFFDEEDRDYTYRPHDQEDLRRMLEAGFNYFDRVLPEQLAYLADKPAFFDLQGFRGHRRPIFPEIFFHPGFQGVEDFLDEPAYLFLEDYEPGPNVTLEQMGRMQEERTQKQLDRLTRGRQPGIVQQLKEAGVTLHGIELAEPPLPIWEELYSTGFYQLGAPVAGFIHEGRYRHPETVDLLNLVCRTDLPREPETMYRFYFAFLRGAARVFDKDWGTSIYGQADPEVSLLGMTMAYDRGARYVWFWSSDRDHHLPFEEQLALARGLAKHVREHPRAPRRELVRAAEDAIVLPYGFTFSVSDWQKARLAPLWQRDAFPVESGRMADGTPYYAVLRCAAEEMENLMRQGREFDIVIDVPEVAEAGYARVHDVLPRARWAKYEYVWYVHYRWWFVLAGLVLFLIVFRTYRIVRWYRRRRARVAEGAAGAG